MREGSAGPDSSRSRWTRRSVPWLTSRTYSASAPERRCSAIWWRRSKIEKRSSVTTRLISSRSEAASCWVSGWSETDSISSTM